MRTITGIHTIGGGRAGATVASGRGGELRLVVLAGGRRLCVDAEQVARHGLAAGGVIGPRLVARLAARDAYLRARERALRLLAIRPRSVDELRSRLLRHRIPRKTLEAVIADLVARGHLDDLAFARGWIISRLASRSCGIRRLRWELRRKEVPVAIIDRAVREAIA